MRKVATNPSVGEYMPPPGGGAAENAAAIFSATGRPTVDWAAQQAAKDQQTGAEIRNGVPHLPREWEAELGTDIKSKPGLPGVTSGFAYGAPSSAPNSGGVHPALLGALLGGGAGALAGAVRPGKRGRLRSMLMGAGAGAGLGGAAGLGYSKMADGLPLGNAVMRAANQAENLPGTVVSRFWDRQYAPDPAAYAATNADTKARIENSIRPAAEQQRFGTTSSAAAVHGMRPGPVTTLPRVSQSAPQAAMDNIAPQPKPYVGSQPSFTPGEYSQPGGVHPALLGALLGGGAGALAGAVRPGKRGRLRSMLLGAGAGAGLGGVAGLGYRKLGAEGEESTDTDDSSLKKKTPPRSKDIVDMDSLRGRLADYFHTPGPGGERAGRSQAMADAIGETSSHSVRHPGINTFLRTAIGGGVGGLAGAGLVAATGGGNDPAVAGAVGSSLGGMLGLLSAGKARRKEMRRIGALYDEDAAAGKVNPQMPQLSSTAALLAPLRGPHRTGQVEAVRAMRGEGSIAEQRPRGRSLGYAAQMLQPYGNLVALGQGYLQNYNTQRASNAEAPPPVYERRPKAVPA